MKAIGNNRGYVGYSMSKRAAEARRDGKYPKGDFKFINDIPAKVFEYLVRIGVIDDSEWHHTSMYGNKTTFYCWADGCKEIFEARRDDVIKACKVRLPKKPTCADDASVEEMKQWVRDIDAYAHELIRVNKEIEHNLKEIFDL
jgi:hypothetical protein